MAFDLSTAMTRTVGSFPRMRTVTPSGLEGAQLTVVTRAVATAQSIEASRVPAVYSRGAVGGGGAEAGGVSAAYGRGQRGRGLKDPCSPSATHPQLAFSISCCC